MNQAQMLRTQIAPLPELAPPTEMERLIATYLIAKEQLSTYVDIQGEAKARMRQIIDETGQTVWDTRSGMVICPADTTIVTYEADALDKLAAASAHFRRKILPFRRETFRAGGIRVTGK